MPEARPADAWRRLAAYDAEHEVLKRNVRVLDLRLPDRLIVREAPDGAGDSALWITHPAFLATPLFPGQPDGSWTLPAEVELAAGTPATVRVVAGQRQPVAGALVEHYLLAGDASPELQRARRVFLRTYATGADGLARAVPAEGDSGFVARLGERLSNSWVGVPEEPVELVLCDRFFLRGTVTVEGREGVPPGARVQLSFEGDGVYDWLSSFPVPESGELGPVECPLLPLPRLHVELYGGGLIAQYVAYDAPLRGETLEVALHSAVGEEARSSTQVQALPKFLTSSAFLSSKVKEFFLFCSGNKQISSSCVSNTYDPSIFSFIQPSYDPSK